MFMYELNCKIIVLLLIKTFIENEVEQKIFA